MTPSTQATAATTRHNAEFRRILVRNVGLPLAAGLVSALLFAIVIGYLTTVLGRVEQTDHVIISASSASKLVVDMEAGLRGFLIAGTPEFLEPFSNAKPLVKKKLAELAKLSADAPEQLARIRQIETLLAEWLVFADRAVERKQALGDVVGFVRTGEGVRLMAAMRGLLDQLMTHEREVRLARNSTASDRVRALVAGFLIISLGFSGVLAWRARRELLVLSNSYDSALASQQRYAAQLEEQTWQRGGQTELADRLMGQLPLSVLGDNTLAFLADYLGAPVGTLYAREPSGELRLAAAYGLDQTQRERKAVFQADEGLVARVARDRQVLQLDDLEPDHLTVTSGLVSAPARTVLLVPTTHDGVVNGVLEIGFLRGLKPAERAFVEVIAHTIGTAIESARYRDRLQDILDETQQLNEELQAQQEELRAANEELEAQARELQQSQAHLEEHQAQLEHANQQLADRGQELTAQRDAVNERNAALRDAQRRLEERAQELAQASRYKSDFLANMSHELRTPLNSSLILARLLADNGKGNLSDEQVRFAESIYMAGNDLLNLINDILDISKVEAGKLDVHPAATPMTRLLEGLESTFQPQALAKGLSFQLALEDHVPPTLFTDRQRLEQILKNLVSNAIKFTEAGSITVAVAAAGENLTFEIRDTGIGIAEEQQGQIFDAFHQADGTISRRFGGTGLGLSISRDLARLLGGDLVVASTPGEGSIFTLTLPKAFGKGAVAETVRGEADQPAPSVQPKYPETPAVSTGAGQAGSQQVVADDRQRAPFAGRCVLVVEDESTFSQILYDLARELGYHCLVAGSADEGLALAREFIPDAVLLDMKLPDHSGLMVLEHLKEEPRTRHIPVHVISVEDRWQPAMQLGAVGYAMKPTTRDELKAIFSRLEARLDQKVKRVLLVEDDPRQREAVTLLIGDTDVEITAVESGRQALGQLQSNVFDCMIVDLQLPDMHGRELLHEMTATEICSFPPVIVYTGRTLSADEEADLMRYSRSIIIKGARSPERLLDEVTLFLHKVESDLSQERRTMLKTARSRDRMIEGRNILLVDDDVRNLFALTSALESKGARVEVGRNGREALEKLEQYPEIDLVLMDVMMPEMDGYEAMERIRQNPQWRRLPIIAVTAKAMKDDQERCLQAGANDYMAKPVDLDRLFSLIRVWLPKLERA